MKIVEFYVSSFHELHDILEDYRHDSRVWRFRGHSDASWKLIPKAGRPGYAWVDDLVVLNSWKRRAVEFLSVSPRNEWEWMAIAQHHGLATRLLDWTTNPLNAAYFAVCENMDTDAVIYAVRPRWLVLEEVSPAEFTGIALFRPRGIVPRITRQVGLFTAHSRPHIPLEDRLDENVEELHRIVIDQEYRNFLLHELAYYGINRMTLFPDLDGLCDFTNWTIRERFYWDLPDEGEDDEVSDDPIDKF